MRASSHRGTTATYSPSKELITKHSKNIKKCKCVTQEVVANISTQSAACLLAVAEQSFVESVSG